MTVPPSVMVDLSRHLADHGDDSGYVFCGLSDGRMTPPTWRLSGVAAGGAARRLAPLRALTWASFMAHEDGPGA